MAALVTFLLTPLVWRVSIRIGAVVVPDERRIHLRPTPTLGGAAMLLALFAALGVAWFLPQFRPVFESSSEPLGVVLAAAIIFARGLPRRPPGGVGPGQGGGPGAGRLGPGAGRA